MKEKHKIKRTMCGISWTTLVCWSLLSVETVGGFLLLRPSTVDTPARQLGRIQKLHMIEEDHFEASRRDALHMMLSVAALSLPLTASASTGSPSVATGPKMEVDLNCLADLPPIPTDSVRIYLCRHGQTENNRLRKVQGSRVNPPINDNGIEQATALGKALSRASTGPPLVMFHSQLKRAQMTAEIASSQISDKIKPQILDSLGEVDFGPVADGMPVALAKAGFSVTFGAWVSDH